MQVTQDPGRSGRVEPPGHRHRDGGEERGGHDEEPQQQVPTQPSVEAVDDQTAPVGVDIPGPLPDPPPLPVQQPVYGGLHPFQRPADGQVLPPQVWATLDGLTMLQRWQQGSLARSPLSNLLGAQVVHADEGRLTITIPASAWFCGMQSAFYGGALALFADYALHGVVQSLLPPGHIWATLDLTVRFLSHLTPNGDPLTADARIVHHGRRLAVASAEISQSGRPAAVRAEAAVMLLGRRGWAELTRLTDEPHELGHPPPR